jgi:hypothetical protein
MIRQKEEERRAANKRLSDEIAAVLRKQYDALPMPRSDLLDDLMERIDDAEGLATKKDLLH